MITLTTRYGYTLHLAEGDDRAKLLVDAGGAMNPHSLDLWRRLVSSHPWELVVDVGANYGEMLLAAPPPPTARVVAFEPNTALLPYLERNLAGGGVTATIEATAIADHVGEESFLVDTHYSGTSRLAPAGDGSVRVPVTTLDAYFADSRASSACVKIDVEGHDVEALRGAKEFVSRLDRVALMVEIVHMAPEVLVELARDWRLHLFDTRVGRLVRVPAGDEAHLVRMATSGWCYLLDAVLLPRPDRWRPM